MINNESATNDQQLSCGGTSPDRLVAWTASVTDFFVFGTFGADFDSIARPASPLTRRVTAAAGEPGALPRSGNAWLAAERSSRRF